MLDEIFSSEYFRKILEEINSNFYNVKQELYIRNELVKIINNNKKGFWAFPEYPKGEKGAAVDLCVMSNNKIDITLEIKYQYPKDLKITKDILSKSVINSILSDINTKTVMGNLCTNFLLIIHEREGLSSFNPPTYVEPIFRGLDKKFTVDDLAFVKMNEMISRKYTRKYHPIRCSKPYESVYHFISYTFA